MWRALTRATSPPRPARTPSSSKTGANTVLQLNLSAPRGSPDQQPPSVIPADQAGRARTWRMAPGSARLRSSITVQSADGAALKAAQNSIARTTTPPASIAKLTKLQPGERPTPRRSGDGPLRRRFNTRVFGLIDQPATAICHTNHLGARSTYLTPLPSIDLLWVRRARTPSLCTYMTPVSYSRFTSVGLLDRVPLDLNCGVRIGLTNVAP